MFEALMSIQEEKTPSELWNETKEILLDTAEKVVGFRKRVKRKSWISDDTYELIKEKREAKQKDTVKYKELKAQAQRSLRVDKQKQLDQMCEELETANCKGNTRCVFQTDHSHRNFKLE